MKNIFRKWQNANLLLKILIGIFVGAILGLLFPGAVPIGYPGILFVGALKAVTPVLVFFLVASSLSKAGKGLGPRFRNVILLYMLSTFVAAVIAVLTHYLFPLTVTLGEGAAQSSVP